MIPYTYEKDFDVNGDALKDMLMLDTVVWPLIDHVDVQGARTIEVYTTKILLSEEEDALISIINAFTVDCETVVRKYLKDTVMDQAMNFGSDLLKEIAANNIYKGKTDEQYHAFLENYVVLIHSLQTGSLKTAYMELSTMVPNGDFTEAELIEFRRRLELFLGV